ncbi:ATP-dependent nuclease [Leptospira stimsonii]|uniref:ATP-dependent nuclease n=1 Tax=Leptospira stimsonii TaxID=2202203 RepID=UPI001AEF5184|nr:AAA family ATPase [Leptospira stimsonii]
MVIDPTNLGSLRICLSKREPIDSTEEQGLHEAAREFHKNALEVQNASDGVRAFIGMVIETLAGDPKILLLDEPEAFLHPALSNKLGKELVSITTSTEKRFFISTHSPNFLMGCIQSGAPVNIVRLNYRQESASARLLLNEKIVNLMRNPLLRSTGVMSALFYEYVIVTESDADRAFYQEINERLLRFESGRGIPNCLFLNAQNKQTIKTNVKPLRELGIPAAGIVDIDIIKDGGSVWMEFLECGSLPTIEKQSLATTRGNLKSKIGDNIDEVKKRGIDVFNPNTKESAENLLNRLAEYGLFIVPCGELECWLKHLGATGHRPNWLISVFEKMGEDLDNPNYVKPSNTDVWNFLDFIQIWLMNPNRKGIPD